MPWRARPAALRLQPRPCSGPRVTRRSWSSWPRWQSFGSVIGSPHRQQVTSSPRRTASRHRFASRSWSASYPRSCRVPRARSLARSCVVQRVRSVSVGQPGSAHTLRGMVTSRALTPRSAGLATQGPRRDVVVGPGRNGERLWGPVASDSAGTLWHTREESNPSLPGWSRPCFRNTSGIGEASGRGLSGLQGWRSHRNTLVSSRHYPLACCQVSPSPGESLGESRHAARVQWLP